MEFGENIHLAVLKTICFAGLTQIVGAVKVSALLAYGTFGSAAAFSNAASHFKQGRRR
jgi:hypothetical protein